MKRCEVCQKLTDNGTKRCQKCGTPFNYDPRVTPFSETKIILGVLFIAIMGLIISNAIPQKLPDPSECSRTSIRRFTALANEYYRKTRNTLRAELLMTRELSELMSYKYAAQDISVPDCLEPAKAELVAYLDEVYKIGRASVWMGYHAAAISTQKAGEHWAAFNTCLDGIRECIPDCP